MTAPLALDPARTALVLVDLMDRIVALPLEPRKGTEVLAAAEELASAFRSAGAPVVLVRVQRPGVADQPPGSGLVAGLARDGDIEIVKRTIGAFQGTDLDARLREHDVTTLVFGGIATNLGVESTARAAGDLGYDLVFVEDAMAAFTTAEHEASTRLDFPRLGTVVTADQVRFTSAD
ncbi:MULTISPECIES: isochorismatase family protein [Streptomyces]|uniref:Isochorismatase n=1 Tax=Streptomyces griseorubiginosus TaxID=67304 RepID=A0A101S332_9ACTN|nr:MULTISPECIES: isochorismatase family protein [Streptomyces]KUM79651.1 isochorismatase [Streptomyces griseorubiginosus]KUN66582.1 isochorismatase [Streptomyces griseorubiginosus]TCR17788.1 nicotinamidase-related amidase [Streptomyces sp. BK205]